MSKKEKQEKEGGKQKKKLETTIEIGINLYIFSFKYIKTVSREKV